MGQTMGKVTPGFDSDIDHIAWDEIRIRVQDGAGGDELHCSEPPTNSRVLLLGSAELFWLIKRHVCYRRFIRTRVLSMDGE